MRSPRRRWRASGALFAAAVVGLGILEPASTPASSLELRGVRDGAEVVHLVPVEAGHELQLHYTHSFGGFEVREFLRVDDTGRCEGFAVVDQHFDDFGAGIGEIPGESAVVSAPGGGWRLEGLHRCVGDSIQVRVGWISGQQLQVDGCQLRLDDLVDESSVLTLELTPHPGDGTRTAFCDLPMSEPVASEAAGSDDDERTGGTGG